jgi:hypothetical protein
VSEATAAAYADALAARIEREAESEAPFGYVNQYDDNRVDTLEEVADFLDDDEKPDGWMDSDHLPDMWEKATGYDFLRDALDIRYVVNGDRSYRDAEICIGLGGPNVWIHTATRELVVHWGFETARRPLPASYIDELDGAAEEVWEMSA